MTTNIVPTDLKPGTEAEQLRHYANKFATGEITRWDLAAHLLEQAADRFEAALPSGVRANHVPRLENCGTYLAKDNKGQWYYLNHDNAWQGYQGPSPTQAPEPAPAPAELEVVAWRRRDPDDTIPEEAAYQYSESKPSGFDDAGWLPLADHNDAQAALTALRAERERLERELEQAENDEQEWMEKATYEVGAVPHLWSDRAKAAEARVAELESLMRKAHAVMRECGWQLAISAEHNGDGVLEAACTEVEADFAEALRTNGGGSNG